MKNSDSKPLRKMPPAQLLCPPLQQREMRWDLQHGEVPFRRVRLFAGDAKTRWSLRIARLLSAKLRKRALRFGVQHAGVWLGWRFLVCFFLLNIWGKSWISSQKQHEFQATVIWIQRFCSTASSHWLFLPRRTNSSRNFPNSWFVLINLFVTNWKNKFRLG